MDKMLETLQAGLPGLDLTLPEERCQKLCAFGTAMVRQNEVMNLTGITDDEGVAKLHLLDSLTVAASVDLAGKSLIDVGCGAGFPGVPLAIACPDTQVTLLDSLGKRMKWLETVLPELGISAQCITARAEDAVNTCRERYDVATSRAVARLPILLELTAAFVRVGGYVVALKGPAAREELAESKNAIKKLGLQVEQILDYRFDDALHSVILLKKVAPTPACYPRKFARIKQKPL